MPRSSASYANRQTLGQHHTDGRLSKLTGINSDRGHETRSFWKGAILSTGGVRDSNGSPEWKSKPFNCAAHAHPFSPPLLRANRKVAALRSARNTLTATRSLQHAARNTLPVTRCPQHAARNTLFLKGGSEKQIDFLKRTLAAIRLRLAL